MNLFTHAARRWDKGTLTWYTDVGTRVSLGSFSVITASGVEHCKGMEQLLPKHIKNRGGTKNEKG